MSTGDSEIVVFAGPSLSGCDLSHYAAFAFLPPARCGDILAALERGATSLLLIDGYFDSTAAPWHKEILAALARGCMVAGAASMGALRAAECERFGMIGVGEVYRLYASGAIDCDSEVAVLHGPPELDYCPLTDAMADIRWRVRQALVSGEIDEAENDRLLAEAEKVHFKQRHWAEIVSRAVSDAGKRARLMARAGDSRKREDALLALRLLRDGKLQRPAGVITRDALQVSQYLAQLAQVVRQDMAAGRR